MGSDLTIVMASSEKKRRRGVLSRVGLIGLLTCATVDLQLVFRNNNNGNSNPAEAKRPVTHLLQARCFQVPRQERA